MAENEEVSVPEPEEGEDEFEYCYGIPLPKLPPGLQPLECVILLTGIDMENGSPTMTSLGSQGMAPWNAVGLMELEVHRLKMGYTFSAIALDDEDEDEDD